MKYKIAYFGYDTVVVDADSAEDAEAKFWENDLNVLFNSEVVEVVDESEGFTSYTDLN